MKTTVTWKGNVAFEAQTQTGHSISMDGAPESGGQNLGARPMELLLSGVGGCASYDVVGILKKGKQEVTDIRCELSATRADTVPAVFEIINLHFVVTGTNIKESLVKKAVELSAEKYCSASRMLQNGGVDITHSFEIVES